MEWTTDIIRDELKRLDTLTGMSAGDLPVWLDDEHQDDFIAAYAFSQDGPEVFHFTRSFFTDKRILDETGYQTIRHEYAHYLDHMLTEGDYLSDDYDAHGPMWQACCSMIGTPACEFYTSDHALLDAVFADPDGFQQWLDENSAA